MRLIDSTLRRCVPGLGVGRRWLKERLAELGVQVRLSEGCVQELVNDAAEATWQCLSATQGGRRYLDVLRAEINARAQFIRLWTTSDERIDAHDEKLANLVRIARNYALPRPWKVPEPVAAQYTRRVPSYWRWASDGVSAAGLGAAGSGLSAGAA
jgi:hypothetical protein